MFMRECASCKKAISDRNSVFMYMPPNTYNEVFFCKSCFGTMLKDAYKRVDIQAKNKKA